ncbi:YdcF family protein [Carnobacterium divergens]|uniref:YdcF family protein n=1 Tax=Carnobacterium divergens TaxID=2748 RepID=UPI0007F5211E|nr:YdcF family protein [Carnobacterium divergens]SBO16380.1 conserved exported hypothetical protein [Carnobacterium divergens]
MKWIKKIFLFGISLLLVGLIIIGSLLFLGTRETPEKNADTILILGAQVRKNPAVPSKVLQERLDASLPYLKENPTTKVIVSGGQGPDESDTEANVMKQYLIAHGIDEKRIQKEDRSTRTEENIANSKKWLHSNHVVIVTSDFHMYRALMLAKRAGIQASGLPAKSTSSATIKSYCREFLALPYGILKDW